jgi:pimeloyl-ACP methyl ester carboxylesterase
MPRKILVMLAVSVLVCPAAPIPSFSQANPDEVRNSKGVTKGMAPTTGYAPVNGLKMYYEIHGQGRPLILLHGSFMTIDLAFGQLIPELSKNRKVIAVELQGHGRTADIDRPLAYNSMADDVAELLKYLESDTADVLGYSMGGGVALQLAISHPQLVRKLVIVSSVFKSDGWSPETRAATQKVSPELFQGTPLKKEYDRLAPDPKHWPQLVNKIKQLNAVPYDFSAQAKSLQAPTLIILGDSDGVRPEHAAEMFRLLGGGVMGDLGRMPDSQLAVFPGTSHVGVMMRTDWLLSMVPPFLDAPIQKAHQ